MRIWAGGLLLALFVLPSGGLRLRMHLLAPHVAVGQAFSVEVQATPAGPPRQRLTVALADAVGHTLWRRTLAAQSAGYWALLAALPSPGRYRLEARVAADERASVAAEVVAIAPPPPYYGGVLAVGAFGLPDALVGALRDHGFAVEDGLTQGPPRVIVVADPSLAGRAAALYPAIWRAVAAGSNLLLLSPPAPDALRYWPFVARLVPYRDDCGTAWDQGSAQLVAGLPPAAAPVLRPDLAYDLRAAGPIELESLAQQLLVRTAEGFAGCRAWFRFRYGQGLVTVSSVPVLERASDAYMRRYLMNLLKVAAVAPRGAAKPGLAAAFARRLAGE